MTLLAVEKQKMEFNTINLKVYNLFITHEKLTEYRLACMLNQQIHMWDKAITCEMLCTGCQVISLRTHYWAKWTNQVNLFGITKSSGVFTNVNVFHEVAGITKFNNVITNCERWRSKLTVVWASLQHFYLIICFHLHFRTLPGLAKLLFTTWNKGTCNKVHCIGNAMLISLKPGHAHSRHNKRHLLYIIYVIVAAKTGINGLITLSWNILYITLR
jgi:hypothetical protein